MVTLSDRAAVEVKGLLEKQEKNFEDDNENFTKNSYDDLIENLITQHYLYYNTLLLIKQTPNHSFFRAVIILSKIKTEIKTEELIIKENDQYTTSFIELLKAYYLKL